MVKEHTGRAVHLRHDHPFGPVHNEGPVRGHQGHVAHKDVLFLDVLDRFGASVFVHIEHDQAQRHLQRCAIGHIPLLTFFDVVLRLLQLVFHELQHSGFVEILDREDRLEHALDPLAIERFKLISGFQEQIVRAFLNLDEVRHFQNFTNFTVVFTQTFLAKEGLSHVR